jgi:Ca2+-binding RTX toxin-like protein
MGVRSGSVMVACSLLFATGLIVAPDALAGSVSLITEEHRGPVAVTRGPAAGLPGAGVTLYDQNDDDQGGAVSAQEFGEGLENYDDMAADDFAVPAGEAWKVSEIDVTGAYWAAQDPGPADSVNVAFHTDASGFPGTPVYSDTVVPAEDDGGSLVLLIKPAVILSPGSTYWLSLQVNMNYMTDGQWGWEMRSTQGGDYVSKWENPLDGFGTGCVTWSDTDACDPVAGVDYMFRLAGSVVACTIDGTSGDDVLTGSPSDDVICGEGGGDVIRGMGGNDILLAGEGEDVLRGGAGRDLLHAVDGAAGNDSLHGGPGARDRCHADDGDVLAGCP